MQKRMEPKIDTERLPYLAERQSVSSDIERSICLLRHDNDPIGLMWARVTRNPIRGSE